MKGLLIKDIYLLKNYKSSLFFIIGMIFVFSIFDVTANYVLVLALTFSITISISGFGYDEISKWEKYAIAMPISRSNVVKSKYIFSILIIFIGMGILFLFSGLGIVITHTGSLNSLVQRTLLGIAIGSVMISVVIPCLFKFGAQKARVVIMFLIGFLAMGITLIGLAIEGVKLPGTMFSVISFVMINEAVALFLVVALVLLVLVLSYFISAKIYQKKEIE